MTSLLKAAFPYVEVRKKRLATGILVVVYAGVRLNETDPANLTEEAKSLGFTLFQKVYYYVIIIVYCLFLSIVWIYNIRVRVAG
jgi:hypothetical protein